MSDVQNPNLAQSAAGFGCACFLSLIMAFLKSQGIIDWSWWIVFIPIWGPMCLGLICGCIVAMVVTIRTMLDQFNNK